MMENARMEWPYPDTHVQGSGGYQQWRQMTINDLLMENRIVFVDMPLSSSLYMQYGGTFGSDIIKKLLRLQYLKKDQDIHMYVNCPGGSIGEILAVYDTMRYRDVLCRYRLQWCGLAPGCGYERKTVLPSSQ